MAVLVTAIFLLVTLIVYRPSTDHVNKNYLQYPRFSAEYSSICNGGHIVGLFEFYLTIH